MLWISAKILCLLFVHMYCYTQYTWVTFTLSLLVSNVSERSEEVRLYMKWIDHVSFLDKAPTRSRTAGMTTTCVTKYLLLTPLRFQLRLFFWSPNAELDLQKKNSETVTKSEFRGDIYVELTLFSVSRTSGI